MMKREDRIKTIILSNNDNTTITQLSKELGISREAIGYALHTYSIVSEYYLKKIEEIKLENEKEIKYLHTNFFNTLNSKEQTISELQDLLEKTKTQVQELKNENKELLSKLEAISFLKKSFWTTLGIVSMIIITFLILIFKKGG